MAVALKICCVETVTGLITRSYDLVTFSSSDEYFFNTNSIRKLASKATIEYVLSLIYFKKEALFQTGLSILS